MTEVKLEKMKTFNNKETKAMQKHKALTLKWLPRAMQTVNIYASLGLLPRAAAS